MDPAHFQVLISGEPKVDSSFVNARSNASRIMSSLVSIWEVRMVSKSFLRLHSFGGFQVCREVLLRQASHLLSDRNKERDRLPVSSLKKWEPNMKMELSGSSMSVFRSHSLSRKRALSILGVTSCGFRKAALKDAEKAICKKRFHIPWMVFMSDKFTRCFWEFRG